MFLLRGNEGKKQVYGTQFHRVDGVLILQPVEDESVVDEMLASVGLEPLEEAVRGMRERDEENRRIKEGV